MSKTRSDISNKTEVNSLRLLGSMYAEKNVLLLSFTVTEGNIIKICPTEKDESLDFSECA